MLLIYRLEVKKAKTLGPFTFYFNCGAIGNIFPTLHVFFSTFYMKKNILNYCKLNRYYLI